MNAGRRRPTGLGVGLALAATVVACRAEGPDGPRAAAASAAPLLSSTRASPLPRTRQVCVGAAHTCALDEAGAVRCWGDNGENQVASDAVAQLHHPVRVPELGPAQRIACGASSSCAVAGGEVTCWGFATGFTNARTVRLPFPAPVADLFVASWGGCAVGRDGKVRCFSRYTSSFDPREVPGITAATGFAPSAHDETPCVEREGASPICFRATTHAPPKAKAGAATAPARVEPIAFTEIGVTQPTVERPRPAPPDRLSGLRGVATSGRHGCGIDEEGAVHCWGRATSGQLGDGTAYLHAPARVPELDAISLSVGEGGACAVRRSGELVCWGRHAEPEDPAPPHDVATPFPADEVAVGASLLDPTRVCAREAKARTWRCRFGSSWLTVDAKFVGRPKPALIDARGRTWNIGLREPPTRDFFFSQIGAAVVTLAHDGYCAIDDRGALVCGHCGACDRPRDVATRIATDEPLVLVGSLTRDAAEETSVCALTRSGSARCWEIAAAPFARAEPKPLAIAGLPSDLVDISSSGGRYAANLTCVRTSEGAVSCFGDRAHLQHAGSRARAARIDGLPPVVGVGTGGTFACAREETGAVWCWGSNRDGGAPDGAPLERPEGVAVARDLPPASAGPPDQ